LESIGTALLGARRETKGRSLSCVRPKESDVFQGTVVGAVSEAAELLYD
jgi:hypothetical protein